MSNTQPSGKIANPQPVPRSSKVVDWNMLVDMRERWRAEAKTVVWTNGCFDLLHIGHTRNLQKARSLGDVLVVGVNSDDSVRTLKGSERPIVPALERVELLAALECVDYVVIFDELTPEAVLSRLKPDIHCKGADYALPHGKAIPEAGLVESYGGRIEFLPLVPSVSTTNLIRRIRERYAPNSRECVAHYSGDSMDSRSLKDTLAAFSGKRVLLVGDVMLDEYIWGEVQRISPEAPVPVVKTKYRTYYPGGAANVAVNIAALGGVPLLCGVIGQDDMGLKLTQVLSETKVITREGLISSPDRPTTVKGRVIARNQQVLRLDTETRQPISTMLEDAVLAWCEQNIDQVDICVLSDYAKGVLSDRVCYQLIEMARSHNLPVVVDPKGRNYQKYAGATLVTPNTNEALLAVNHIDQDSFDLDLIAHRLLDQLAGANLLITREAEGMSLYMSEGMKLHIPAKSKSVYDVTGAGDTVVATLAMALSTGATLNQVVYLANLAAGLVVSKFGAATVTCNEIMTVIDGV